MVGRASSCPGDRDQLLYQSLLMAAGMKESGAGQVHVASGPKREVGSLWFEPSTPIPRVYPVSVSSFNEAFANSVSSLSPFLALL